MGIALFLNQSEIFCLLFSVFRLFTFKVIIILFNTSGFPGIQMVRNLLAMWENLIQSLGLEDPLEKGMANHSSILTSRIPWAEEPVGYGSWGHKESDTTELTNTF